MKFSTTKPIDGLSRVNDCKFTAWFEFPRCDHCSALAGIANQDCSCCASSAICFELGKLFDGRRTTAILISEYGMLQPIVHQGQAGLHCCKLRILLLCLPWHNWMIVRWQIQLKAANEQQPRLLGLGAFWLRITSGWSFFYQVDIQNRYAKLIRLIPNLSSDLVGKVPQKRQDCADLVKNVAINFWRGTSLHPDEGVKDTQNVHINFPPIPNLACYPQELRH